MCVSVAEAKCHQEWLLSQIYHVFESSVYSKLGTKVLSIFGSSCVPWITSCYDERWELRVVRAESNKHQPTFMFKLKLFDQYRLYFIRYHFNMFHVSCVALVSRETAAIHRKQYPFNLRVGGHLNN